MRITILGAGSWGTTLAIILHQNNHQVSCWSFDADDVKTILQTRINEKFLPGVNIPDAIRVTNNLEESIQDAEVVVVAVPSHVVRSVMGQLRLIQPKNAIWINVAKGIENGTLMRVSQVIQTVGEIDPLKVAVLFGPSHAEEVSHQIPTAIVAASTSKETATVVQHLFLTPYFRVYANLDIIGVELGGALKNIIALAAGICDGAGFGDNTKAALMTRGLAEINRLGVQLGASADTFAGLSGMGDLIVTCMSKHSRNRYVGEQIGRGRNLKEVLDEMVMVAEGVRTTESAYQLAQRENIDMPITEQVYKALFEGKPPVEAMKDLMTRESKIEDWG
ncbi:MAG: NAD(P)H-dependent glycerol-3-phosphate dehydrogenase [Calditrichales bacterium]|nr:MAG: NAD(P)H-dependent glycerol-3-phosphate dehydrogenase [Calditrichales bacterium]